MPGMAGMHMHKIEIPKGSQITVADVEFMQGMIAHHAQAVYMSQLAAGHGASPRVLAMATMTCLAATAPLLSGSSDLGLGYLVDSILTACAAASIMFVTACRRWLSESEKNLPSAT